MMRVNHEYDRGGALAYLAACCRALILQTTASFTMPTHGHGHRRHVGGLIVTLPVGDANGRPATRAAGGAAAPLPLLGALGACGAGRLALDSRAPA